MDNAANYFVVHSKYFIRLETICPLLKLDFVHSQLRRYQVLVLLVLNHVVKHTVLLKPSQTFCSLP